MKLGFVKIPDPNAPEAPADGIAIHDLTLDGNNQRASTFDAFLPEKIAIERKNSLKICPKAIVDQISMSKQDGKLTCRKVVFKSSDPTSKKKYSATVRKEVIICSGAISSPQVLMLR
jgi:choline dehydrogenase-like flavoprotein